MEIKRRLARHDLCIGYARFLLILSHLQARVFVPPLTIDHILETAHAVAPSEAAGLSKVLPALIPITICIPVIITFPRSLRNSGIARGRRS
jgi:hypothetical protein